jgi:hypothetical protein
VRDLRKLETLLDVRAPGSHDPVDASKEAPLRNKKERERERERERENRGSLFCACDLRPWLSLRLRLYGPTVKMTRDFRAQKAPPVLKAVPLFPPRSCLGRFSRKESTAEGGALSFQFAFKVLKRAPDLIYYRRMCAYVSEGHSSSASRGASFFLARNFRANSLYD